MKPLFAGNIGFTTHARKRLKERNIEASYVKAHLAFIPYEKGVREWRIPRTDIIVIFHDLSEEKRSVITLWRVEPKSIQKRGRH